MTTPNETDSTGTIKAIISNEGLETDFFWSRSLTCISSFGLGLEVMWLRSRDF